MIKPSYFDAVSAIVGNDKLCGGTTNGPLDEIVFVKGFNDLPTEEQIQAKLTELQADYDAKQYQRDRADDYPSWQEQMDLLYHGGVDALKAELKKTKDKFPKPE